MAVALARPDGSVSGSKGLAPFLIPRYDASGASATGITLHRLKDKLGTRAVPTAEVGLSDVHALPVGEPDGRGIHRMMTLVLITRLHNSSAAASGMRRGLAYAQAYAAERSVAGGQLTRNPLHRATLSTLAVDAHAAFALTAHAFALLGRVEVADDPLAEQELRLVAPIAKLATGRLAVNSASEYLECFGGAGYVEDTGIPRLLRDAQVLPIWEGTTNVLAVDVVRALAHDPGLAKVFLARLDEASVQASAAGLGGAEDGLRSARLVLSDALEAAATEPRSEKVLAGARAMALTMGNALALALLVEHAALTDEEGTRAAADLWGRSRLSNDDTTADAHAAFEVLCP
jgi:hypothetical protein